MSGIITTVCKATFNPVIATAVFGETVGWLVNAGRDRVAEKLQDGDVADEEFRRIIMSEIYEMKLKLDGESKKDLSASISHFEEGIKLLYEVLKEIRPRRDTGADAAQAASAEAVSLTEGMRNLELTESTTRKLTNAKDRFKIAREKATDAFSNEALSTFDRILAMQYRVIATVLETVDYPADALTSCKHCIDELNGLPVVQQSLKVQLKTGISNVKGWFSQKERQKLISGVCLVNRVAYDVTRTISVKEPLPQWPMVDTGQEKVDLLRDERVTRALCKQGMEHCSVSWILGQDGVNVDSINDPCNIATDSSGQYIVADSNLIIKVFDNNGKFVKSFRLPPLIDDNGTELSIDSWPVHLATDMNDDIYALVKEKNRKDSHWIFKFNKIVEKHLRFRVREMGFDFYLCKLSVSDSGKVLVLKGDWRKEYYIVDVYETDGRFVCSFGEQILRSPRDITVTASDGRVMVVELFPSRCVHIFSENGDHLSKFDLQDSLHHPNIAFHKESQQVIVASTDSTENLLHVGIYTKDGKFLRSTLIHKEIFGLHGIVVTTEGRIAAVAKFKDNTGKVIII